MRPVAPKMARDVGMGSDFKRWHADDADFNADFTRLDSMKPADRRGLELPRGFENFSPELGFGADMEQKSHFD
jgi:hypothetical protein